MPSKKPLIALRLDKALHEKIVALAKAEGRKPANYIEHQIRISLNTPPWASKAVPWHPPGPAAVVPPAPKPAPAAAAAAPAPAAPHKPWANLAASKIGMITTADFLIPGDWIEADTRLTYREYLETYGDPSAESFFEPPPKKVDAISDAEVAAALAVTGKALGE